MPFSLVLPFETEPNVADATFIVELTPIVLNGTTAAFADTVAGIGDCDGNGYDDVLVGATDQDSAFLYLGSSEGFPTLSSKTLSADGAPGYGYSVASLWRSDRTRNLWNRAQAPPQLRIQL